MLHPSIHAGAEIRIVQLNDDLAQAWVNYMLDLDGGVFARTVPLTITPTIGSAGSPKWLRHCIEELLKSL